MKKSLLALAVAAALPAVAQAQSSVTLYGIVDTGVEYLNKAASTTATAGFRLMDTNASWNGSRFGVRGSEPIGNSGLSAIFNLETRLGVDTGNTGGATYTAVNGSALGQTSTSTAANTQFWNGVASVGLKGGFGELTMGRQYTPAFYAWYFADFTANAGYQNWALISTPGYSTTANPTWALGTNASYGAVRADNSIMLNSTLGALNVRAMVAMGEAAQTGTSAGSAAGDLYALSASWQLGKTLTVYGFYNKQDSFVAGTMDNSYGVAGKMDLGTMGLTLGYSSLELHNGTSFDTILGSAYIKVGAAGTVYANAHRVHASDKKDAMNIGLSYVHALSNRTAIYLQGSRADLTDYSKGTQTKVALGLNHKF